MRVKRKGLTIIELILTIALIAIGLQLIFTIFYTGNKSFDLSRNKGFAQQDFRLTAINLDNELKTARDLKIESDIFVGKFYSLSIDEDGNLIRTTYEDEAVQGKSILANSVSELIFRHLEGDVEGILTVLIQAEIGGELVQDEYKIILENLPDFNTIVEDKGIIYYTKY